VDEGLPAVHAEVLFLYLFQQIIGMGTGKPDGGPAHIVVFAIDIQKIGGYLLLEGKHIDVFKSAANLEGKAYGAIVLGGLRLGDDAPCQ
jgi:hypothetical protein